MTNTDAVILIEWIQQTTYKPNEWEADFLTSILEQLANGRDLSPKQSAVLQGIYEKSADNKQWQRREII